jgi:hypothetical protein
MAVKKFTPETLLALATETLKAELLPALPADKRYAAAMVINALDIARRGITTTDDAPLFALLDTVYDDGDGTPADLSRDIRAGVVTEATYPGGRRTQGPQPPFPALAWPQDMINTSGGDLADQPCLAFIVALRSFQAVLHSDDSLASLAVMQAAMTPRPAPLPGCSLPAGWVD